MPLKFVSIFLVLLSLLHQGGAAAAAVKPLNSWNLKDAIRLWQYNQTAAEDLYGGPIEEWDTSRVTRMDNGFDGAFAYAENFTADLSKWNVSGLTSIERAFEHTKNFAANISTWDTSRVKSMWFAFGASENFTSDVSRWNLSAVKNMADIFWSSKNFGANVSTWDTSNVTYMDSAFHRSENFAADLSQWNVSSAFGSFGDLFAGTKSFSANISTWDTSQVTSLSGYFGAFSASENFTSDLSQWNVSALRIMEYSFSSSKSFGANISTWDTSQVESLIGAFYNTESFLPDLSQWKVSACTSMDSILQSTKNFRANLSSWDTSKVKRMANAFTSSENFTSDVSQWNVSATTSMAEILKDSKGFISDLSNWNTSKVKDFTRAFYNASWFQTTLCWDLSSADPWTLTNFSCLTNGGMSCGCPSLNLSSGDATTTARSSSANVPINLCKIINSQCHDSSPPCILGAPPEDSTTSVAKSTSLNFCSAVSEGANLAQASGILEEVVVRSPLANDQKIQRGKHEAEDDALIVPATVSRGVAFGGVGLPCLILVALATLLNSHFLVCRNAR